ncbi:hypothetical protein D9756_002616 [Leucocoprinus leucothites]|uniref:Protein kinase domain-containing protein n=1 Tax=Leucocoprinus leucothites TaxID=201217 RepID=A0A8H5LLP2_9AGAR|nr:hypothetical protein D9756_002616 [Leucoagaricus leucothites]
MASQSSQGEAVTHTICNESDTFATLHHLVSRIDTESRTRDLVEEALQLEPEELQLLVDCLSLALDREAVPLKARTYVWHALIGVASSAKIFAHNHTLHVNQIILENDTLSGVRRIAQESPVRVKVLKRADDNPDGLFSKPLISWTHLWNPNILPLLAVFLDDDSHPSLVTPCIAQINICDYIRKHPDVPRVLLVSDIVNGLLCLHQLGLVHGGLDPDSVLISDEGRALIMNPAFASDPQDSDSFPVRYSAPELLGEDDSQEPTQASDMWSFACLCYEILSGKVPFFQIAKDFRVAGAISQGSKPLRPGQEGVDGSSIDDAVWRLLLLCWKFEPEERPPCLKVHQILLGMGVHNGHPGMKPLVRSEAIKLSSFDLERAKTSLTRILGSDDQTFFRVPEHLRSSLSNLVPNAAKFGETAIAARKLSPDDTQQLVDFLDLALEDHPDWTASECRATRMLLSTVMMSTYIIPQRYKLIGAQYDNETVIEERSFGRAYKGRGPQMRVNVVTDSTVIRRVLRSMPDWSHSSHPNIIPFCGVFRDSANESLHLCVVTPLWRNGNLHEYAPTLPPRSRIPLLSDIINGLVYLHNVVKISPSYLAPEIIQISDQGRAVITMFGAAAIFIDSNSLLWTRVLRFTAPGGNKDASDDIWTFGCLCYEVLSRKPPYYYYSEEIQLRIALAIGRLPSRPSYADNDVDEIDDEAWNLIMECCRVNRSERPDASEIQEKLINIQIEDSRPQIENSPGNDISPLRSHADVNFLRVEALLDVAMAATKLQPDDTRTFVDFLDLALKDHLSISEERNRVLALLSRITSSTRIFPQRYELKGIKYDSKPLAEGGFGKVYQTPDQHMCVKVMTQADHKASAEWIKELILWAHSSHSNILPFYGVFLESKNDSSSQYICLVSPFMKNRNLQDYAPRLAQKARLPLISDVINGLQYLHGLGIVHSDLKGQNVLISNEGRGLITDFGASHIMTATAAATGSFVFTLRFSAPEVILGGRRWQPTKECDIWSFGCLCYEVLSRRVPYHEYNLDIQITAALARKQPPKRPVSIDRDGTDESDEDDWDDFGFDDEDWDPIDDQGWNLITKCCTPEPEDRLKISAIQELLADMKVWDDRPPMKDVPGADIFRPRLDPEIDLNRAGEILDKLQTLVVPSEPDPQPDFVDMYNELE